MRRGLADLAALREHRDGRAAHGRRDRRRQALRVEEGLDVVPVELEADEAPCRAPGGLLGLQRAPADVVALVE